MSQQSFYLTVTSLVTCHHTDAATCWYCGAFLPASSRLTMSHEEKSGMALTRHTASRRSASATTGNISMDSLAVSHMSSRNNGPRGSNAAAPALISWVSITTSDEHYPSV